MKPARKRKLLILIFLVSGLTLATLLVLYALRQNINLFYTPSQVMNNQVPKHHSIRLGGMVVPGSIMRSTKSLTVRFKVTDYHDTIEVIYTGILPDLFREGQGIVAQGQLLKNHLFRAEQVLAKHDEKYMPPEVKEALNKGRAQG